MNNQHVLLLASKSYSRQMLLRNALIPFLVIAQEADETSCDWTLPLGEVVLSIARLKMQHAIVPLGEKENDICFVLTADTLIEDVYGHKQGKPIDLEDAYKKIEILKQGAKLATGFCVVKNQWNGQKWVGIAQEEGVVFTDYTIIIPDKWKKQYFANTIALQCAGSHAGEDFGMQFMKYLNGSYSGALGLPLFELRESLEKLGFYQQNA